MTGQTRKPLVIIESPFKADNGLERRKYLLYARACVRDAIMRGEAPMASHLLYTQDGILNDDVPAERKLGIETGLEWRHRADRSVVYEDFGISPGMQKGIEAAEAAGLTVDRRRLPAEIVEKIVSEAARERIEIEVQADNGEVRKVAIEIFVGDGFDLRLPNRDGTETALMIDLSQGGWRGFIAEGLADHFACINFGNKGVFVNSETPKPRHLVGADRDMVTGFDAEGNLLTQTASRDEIVEMTDANTAPQNSPA